MLNLITENEKRMMMNYISDYAVKAEPVTKMADFDYIFRLWEKAKSEYLFNLFGGKLILETDMSFANPDKLVEKELDRAIYGFGDAKNEDIASFIENIRNTARKAYGNSNTSAFWAISDLCRVEALVKNKYTEGTISFESPFTNKEIKVQNGCKAVRMLGKIAEDMGVKGFEEFRTALSIITTKKDIKGKFCLSIHPFDYMTMSDNGYDWSSCMSWKEDGCYKQGTIEMMNSPMVVVAYFKSGEDDFVLNADRPEEKWNNKKWRELFIINEDVITNIKAYPYLNSEFSRFALNWLVKLAREANFSDYENYHSEWSYESQPDYIDIEFDTNNMYNDFEADCVQYSYFKKDLHDLYCYYSGEPECVYSGEEDPEFESEHSSLVSINIYENEVCECCGHRVRMGSMSHERGRAYCSECYYNLVSDEITGEKLFPDEEMHLRVAYREDTPVEGRFIRNPANYWEPLPLPEAQRGHTVINWPFCNITIHKDTTPEAFKKYFQTELHKVTSERGEHFAIIYIDEINDTIAEMTSPCHTNKEELLRRLKEKFEIEL